MEHTEKISHPSLTAEIRSFFLRFFQDQGHTIAPSSPLVPHHDPTLLFTNAGMVQFKDVLTGKEQRPYTRATSAQKCVRAGGKHNDLENVGFTVRHHTFFEMLGNFSFGDYFKEEAINFAWDLIVNGFQVSPDRLCVTVYAEDEEAFSLWKKITMWPDSKIIRISSSDNFWSMGDLGPCGPCTEIFYDHGPSIPGGPPGSADQDGDRFVELWNLVFMQFEQISSTERINLPLPCVDTGMGIERIAAVVQGSVDNFGTDVLKALIVKASELTKQNPYGDGRFSYRVIADHVRAGCFLIADGVLPSNEGRGYVLRRILRRAARHAYLLGYGEPLMAQIAPTLIETMGGHYDELVRAQPLILQTLLLEENRFQKTLDRGEGLLKDAIKDLGTGQKLPGSVAFKLYDTFGYPIDVTQDILREHGLEVDIQAFEQEMENQRQQARASWVGSGETRVEDIYGSLLNTCGETEFLGYAEATATGKTQALLLKGEEVDEVGTPLQEFDLITDRTPFYAESGGQQGDQGSVESEHGQAVIDDTVKKNGLFVHKARLLKGKFRKGDDVSLSIDPVRRRQLTQHHSATHLLHQALRHVLGDHVSQKGSLVEPARLRFDFSHPTPLTAEQLQRIESIVNQEIRADTPSSTIVMSPQEASQAGALALFGEKYGETVRVVSMGKQDEKREGRVFSTELCGGTHVERTGQLGFFKIVRETGISAGIRRIEAQVGQAAEERVYAMERALGSVAHHLKCSFSDCTDKVEALIKQNRQLVRELSQVKGERLRDQATQDLQRETLCLGNHGEIHLVHQHLQGRTASELPSLMDRLKVEHPQRTIHLITNVVAPDKLSLLVGVNSDVVPIVDAVSLIQKLTPLMGGKGGGGRPDFAQGGGKDVEKSGQGLVFLEEILRELLTS